VASADLRSALAFLLLLVGVVLVPVATAARWAHDVVVPADGFVSTLAPLASDPVVTGEVEDRLVTATTRQIQASTGVGDDQVQPLVRLAVRRAVDDPGFARVWRTSTRDVHAQLVTALSRPALSKPSASDVALQLGPLSGAVRQQLVSSGVPFAEQLPTVQAAVPLLPGSRLVRARGAYALLVDWGPLLTIVTLLLIAVGALVARHRARALRRACLGALLGLGLLAAVLLVVRHAGPTALSGSMPGGLPEPVARAVFDTLTAGLRRYVLGVAAGTVVVLVGALVAGATGSGRTRH
jgi:hypothetical protein